MSIYNISRCWFDWSFENPELIKPTHSALLFFAVEHCNRLGWKEKFGLPTTMAMEAIGIKSYNTYKTTLNDLVQFGFIKLVQKSKNQYSANIIALSNFNKATNKAHDKALDKALIKHGQKQKESTNQSTNQSNDSIDIQDNKDTILQDTIGSNPTPTVLKKQFLEFVFLTENEYQKLVTQYGEQDTQKMIEKLNAYKGTYGKKTKSDFHAIGYWVKEWLKEEKDKESRAAKIGEKQPQIPPQIPKVEPDYSKTSFY